MHPQSEGEMTISEAYTQLDVALVEFHNDMIRRFGLRRELAPSLWFDEFLVWIKGYDFKGK